MLNLPNSKPPDGKFLLLMVAASMAVSAHLAFTDPDYRPEFAEMTKMALCGFIGWMMPRK